MAVERQMHGGGTHPEAVRKFLGTELAAGGMTSVWSSGRFKHLRSVFGLWLNGQPRKDRRQMFVRRGIAGTFTVLVASTPAASRGSPNDLLRVPATTLLNARIPKKTIAGSGTVISCGLVRFRVNRVDP
jgi:hypothetical protein